ncbi:L-aspartate oxidase [Microbacterium aoyamense]|uniref:L-aspartate oxidase n=1 Tax=Microbacterium aoyamense TaxID=344166 RepID=A0ABP5BA19_9MICO|nr:L-aspartate oxidase [Microbacterium aoyamense]
MSASPSERFVSHDTPLPGIHSEANRDTGAVHAVVVGSGIAGLTVALHAVERGCRVTLVTKDVLDHANTRFAQGGIAGVMFADDRAADHIRDTLVAGAGLSDPEAVRVLVEEGPTRIQELVDIGVVFDRGDDGAYIKGLEAAHSYPRILHAGGDATGTEIEKALVARLRASDVRVIEHAFLVDLLMADANPSDPVEPGLEDAGFDENLRARDARRVSGVELLVGDGPDATGVRETIEADAVVLATGGAGELYAHTTNPPVATGDGIAAALRAGAVVQDLEFFQFHPTILGAGDAFLVSEAVRGEGATLVDEHGRRFAFDAHPDGELAPRDVVARAIAHRMELQDGRPVFLDATHLRPTEAETRAFLAKRFPTIDAAVRARGLDWAREPIPVTPAAHYLMGGVTTDLHGRTSIPGLYAVGEVARTGVHGANRLASNSLLEGAVFGARAGDAIAADAASGIWPTPATPETVPSAVEPGWRRTPSVVGPFSRHALQQLMWEHAGLVRDAAGLRSAASTLDAWSRQDRAPRTEAELEDENLLTVAIALVDAALLRTASVGAHFRSDEHPPTVADALAGTVTIDDVLAANPYPSGSMPARWWIDDVQRDYFAKAHA